MERDRTITSLQHPLVKHLTKLRVDASYRYAHQRLVLDGIKPIQEVSHRITKLFYAPQCAAFAQALGVESWEVTDGIIHKISGMASPEGIVAEVQMPTFQPLYGVHRVVALDAIADPGNLGTLLRTALALGWDMVCLLPGCCDLFNEKVLRAARGAHFKLKLAKASSENLQEWSHKEGAQALVADLHGISPECIEISSERLLVLGNEAHGPSVSIRQFCKPVTIPMPGEMESLNVAVSGGILLYLLNKGSL